MRVAVGGSASVPVMDGHKQRQALTAAERSIGYLIAGKADDAQRAAARAGALDQVGAFAGLVGAVGLAAADLRSLGSIRPAHVDGLLGAVGPGPLAALVEQLR